MLLSRVQSNFASPMKSPGKSACRVKISYNSIHKIIYQKTSMDFHFFRDTFGISLGKDRDRNPTVFQVEIKNGQEVHISKNSFTTPVQIRYSPDQPWKSLLVSDGFELKNTVFANVDGKEIKIEKLSGTVPFAESKLMNMTISPEDNKKPTVFLRKNQPIKQEEHKMDSSPQTKEQSPMRISKRLEEFGLEDRKKKTPKKSSNIWDYFGHILNSRKNSVNKSEYTSQTQDGKSIQRLSSPIAIEEKIIKEEHDTHSMPLDFGHKRLDDVGPILEKRKNGPSLSDVEDEFEAEGKIFRKKVKEDENFADYDDIENFEYYELPTTDSDQIKKDKRCISPVKMIEPSQMPIPKRNRIKAIQIFDDDDEETEMFYGDSRSINDISKTKDEDIYVTNKKGNIEEEEKESVYFTSSQKVLKDFTKASQKTPASPCSKKNVNNEESKLKRLKKIVHDRRETLNKASLSKSHMCAEENGDKSAKETCPICLCDIVKEMGKLDECIHTFCFDCIKDWSDVTNECPLCKRRFNEISKFLLNESGQMAKIDSIKVEFKKQRVHEDGAEEYIEEDIDENCYECGGDEDPNVLLICDACGFYCCHTYCCNPPLDEIPEEDWFCKYCERSYRRSRRRNGNTRNNSSRNQAPPVEQNRSTRRLTRNSAREGQQSLLERLFQMADQTNGDETFLDLDFIREDEATYSDQELLESGEISNASRNRQRGGERTNRNGQRRLQRNTRNSPPEERNGRRRAREETEALFGESQVIELDNFYFNGSGSRRNNQASTNQSRPSNRMNIETPTRNTNPISMDDLNQFKYSLRTQGRANF